MNSSRFILGDWGTSNVRLVLVEDGVVVARAEGPGIALADNGPAETFEHLTREWSPAPAYLCGMVGASIGWVEAGYIPTPMSLEELAVNLTHFDFNGQSIRIIPGLSSNNTLGAPDFMRGEETQLLGVLTQDNNMSTGRHLICLPGSHTKWVIMEEGAVQYFQTALTGEMFAATINHSVLVGKAKLDRVVDSLAFETAVQRAVTRPEAGLLHKLFEVRARQLSGELAEDDATAFLSGLFIGEDVRGALASVGKDLAQGSKVKVIGAPVMGQGYCEALRAFGVEAEWEDGAELSLAGLKYIAENLSLG